MIAYHSFIVEARVISVWGRYKTIQHTKLCEHHEFLSTPITLKM